MYLLGNKKSKIKHNTLYNKYKDGGMKNVNLVHKMVSLKYSGIRLCNENVHEWKLISLHCIKKYVGKEFKFHSKVNFQ